jgi:metallo-beta-lactamase family protein
VTGIRLTFWGAAGQVTGSMHLLEAAGGRFLLDAGLFQGHRTQAHELNARLPFDPRRLDGIVLSHAHIDHSGRLPLLLRHGFHAPVYATPATRDLCAVMLPDAAHIQEQDYRYLVRRGKAGPASEPLYTLADAIGAQELMVGVPYRRITHLRKHLALEFVDAGHILGSAIIQVRVTERGGEPERTIVFSGDLGRPGTPIIRDPTILADADYILIESTYGGREHEPGEEAIRVLADTVRLVAESNGVLLVPSFAIGRTQEVVWQLDRLIDEGAIPLLPLYLDSPMASKASDIYRRHAEYFDEETAKLLREGDTPLDYPDQHVTRRVEESQAIATAPRPYMIVASNGMLTGGRVVGHLRNLIGDPDATILFVGYQGQGTLGAHLQAGATRVKIDGQLRDVHCQIRSISGFSAHADESELLEWLSNFTRNKRPGDRGFPRRVFLVHGDPQAQIAIEPKVKALGFETKIPHWRERVVLD